MFLLTHKPGLFFRVAGAKINARRRLPLLPVQKRTNGVLFEYSLKDYHGTSAMYYGAYQLPLMEHMKRFLRPGGTFIDVGANIGYVSAVGAGLVGKSGQVHSFEPVPAHFEHLRKLCDLNPEFRIDINNCALGDCEGAAPVWVTYEGGQSTLVDGYKSGSEVKEKITVPVKRLDQYIEEKGITAISLIKIDVEGFELLVLKGLSRYFEKSGDRPPIVCEIAPRAYFLMHSPVAELQGYMQQFGYEARDTIDPSHAIDISEMKSVDDVLFLPKDGSRTAADPVSRAE